MLIQFKKKLYLPLIALISIAVFLSCKKDVNNNTTPTPVVETPDLTTTVNVNAVSGFVTDENNAPVQGADVRSGTAAPVTTDQYGYFEIKNTNVVKTAAVVTVTKAGYFKGIKTFAATAGRSPFFRIKLIPKTIKGAFNSGTGGNVTIVGGLVIALPSNAVVNAATNTAYTGTVNVAVSWLNPEASDLTEIMPGDLRGIAEDGSMKGLTTFGMTAVELTGGAGELLQIASGKKATITMPLSATLSAAAPTSIPLWYFDENNGLWKQDGSATRSGNTYVGDVSHFSWWNCDLPNAIVPLTFTVVDNTGNPVANAHVEITPTTSGSWSHIGGSTDATGYVSVFVTPDNSYDLEVYSTCNVWGGTPDYSQNFSVTTTAVDLGNVVVSVAATATVTGTITNCAGLPVIHGSIVVQQNTYYYTRYPVDNTGAYSFTTVLCNGSLNVTLIAEDYDAGLQSTPVNYTLNSGANTVGSINACAVNSNEFVNYAVDGGALIHFTTPGDSIVQSGNGSSSTSWIMANNYSPTSNEYIEFSMDNTGIAAGSSQNILGLSCSAIGDQTTISGASTVNITEYGAVGDYIAGSFVANVTTTMGVPHSVAGTFRVRRNF